MGSKLKSVKGYTTGVFDLFHIGHLNILKKAKENCDKLIVGVNTDELVESYKGKSPIIPFEDRIEIIKSLECVDKALPVSHRDKIQQFHEIKYDILFVGDDWKNSEIFSELEKVISKFGSTIKYFTYTENVSSSKFRELLLEIYKI
jgi:glycerol-3-phosphate cytidylyltransferase